MKSVSQLYEKCDRSFIFIFTLVLLHIFVKHCLDNPQMNCFVCDYEVGSSCSDCYIPLAVSGIMSHLVC